MNCEIEFGGQSLHLRLPPGTDLLRLPVDPPLPDPASAIQHALRSPLNAPPLATMIRCKRKQVPDPRVVIVVSDNTRPVPYRGQNGILKPLIETLRSESIRHIEILVATGTHRALSDDELHQLLPATVFDGDIVVTNHVCTDADRLRTIGKTPGGTTVAINARYLDADLKILTGLVEPHFMAGASGGPKSVCPGLVGDSVTQNFHGPAFMAHERSDSLVLEGNPCYAEAMTVAGMAGVDFILNVTLNGARQITGVYAGELAAAHRAAVNRIRERAAIPFERSYDLVVTHAGFVGINHYQTGKAGVEAAKVVKPDGWIVLAAHHTDVDPVGGPHYRQLLPLLTQLGEAEFTRRLLSPQWSFVHEQWGVQMWGRVFRKLEKMNQLVYCAPALTGLNFQNCGIPGTDGGQGITGCSGTPLAEAMVQRAIDQYHTAHPTSHVAVLLDGPYGVPVPAGSEQGFLNNTSSPHLIGYT